MVAIEVLHANRRKSSVISAAMLARLHNSINSPSRLGVHGLLKFDFHIHVNWGTLPDGLVKPHPNKNVY